MLRLIEWKGRRVRGGIGVVERSGEGAGGGLVLCRGGVGPASQTDGRGTYRNPILAVVDASAIGKDVDVGAFGAEFAVSLCGKGNC